LKVCNNCTLNDNIFSVKINEEGLCNYCQQQMKSENKVEDKAGSEEFDRNESFEKKEKQFFEACSEYSHLPYQVVLAYSGGKDSTYALYLLRKKYKVSVLAVTFDNGFLTQQCRQNIHEVTANLGVDNITIKPSFDNLAKAFNFAGSHEIFSRKSLERASSICTTCIGIVKASIYKEAILRRIPFVSFGWTPGQINLKASIVKLDYKMLLANQKQIEEPLVNNLGNEYKKYFLDAQWLEAQKEYIPSLAHPLVFSNYDENSIIQTIERIGWKRPEDTDMNSTNCLLNSYANLIHAKQYGYNPYCLEIGNLVREGFLSREEGLRKLENSGEDAVIGYVMNELEKYL
jgi:tRNA(Ile)-lysidine synthase TilS/MesJ